VTRPAERLVEAHHVDAAEFMRTVESMAQDEDPASEAVRREREEEWR
jgi:hypothetical protein